MAKKAVGSTDYTRVCKTCGSSRLISEAYAKDKGPNARQVAGMAEGGRCTTIGRQREKYSMQSSALQAHQDQFIANTGHKPELWID